MFVQGYFVIVKDWKQLKLLSVEWLKKKLWHIHTICGCKKKLRSFSIYWYHFQDKLSGKNMGRGAELSIVYYYLCKIEKTILHMHKISAAGNTACLQSGKTGCLWHRGGTFTDNISIFWILKQYIPSIKKKKKHVKIKTSNNNKKKRELKIPEFCYTFVFCQRDVLKFTL